MEALFSLILFTGIVFAAGFCASDMVREYQWINGRKKATQMSRQNRIRNFNYKL